MVERITSRRSTLRTLPALREEALPRPRAQRMCRGVHTESSADRSEMGQIDRSRRRRGCAGALRHKICTASLDNRPLIDGFVWRFSHGRSLPAASLATDHCSLATLPRHYSEPMLFGQSGVNLADLRTVKLSPARLIRLIRTACCTVRSSGSVSVCQRTHTARRLAA